MFGNLTVLDEERKQILVEKLRSGDLSKQGEEELICGHLRLGLKLVRKIGYRYEIKDRSDLEGVMALTIVKAVEDGKTRLVDNNITKYIVKTVIYKLKTHIKTFLAAHKSERTIRHKLQKGINKKKINIKEIENLEPDKAELMKKLDPIRQYQHLEDAKISTVKELKAIVQNAIYESLNIPHRLQIYQDVPRALFSGGGLSEDFDYTKGYIPFARETIRLELLEAIKMTAQTPMEQAILELRAEGYTYKEIEQKVGYHFVVVGDKVRAMEQRFEEIWR